MYVAQQRRLTNRQKQSVVNIDIKRHRAGSGINGGERGGEMA